MSPGSLDSIRVSAHQARTGSPSSSLRRDGGRKLQSAIEDDPVNQCDQVLVFDMSFWNPEITCMLHPPEAKPRAGSTALRSRESAARLRDDQPLRPVRAIALSGGASVHSVRRDPVRAAHEPGENSLLRRPGNSDKVGFSALTNACSSTSAIAHSWCMRSGRTCRRGRSSTASRSHPVETSSTGHQPGEAIRNPGPGP
jgi:hypothetical protein